MALQPVKKNIGDGGIPIFQSVDHTLRGGATLDATGLTAGAILKAGTPMYVNEATRKATVAVTDKTSGESNAVGLLYEDVIVEANANVDVVIEGIVYENRIPAVADEVKAKLQGLIIFSKSF